MYIYTTVDRGRERNLNEAVMEVHSNKRSSQSRISLQSSVYSVPDNGFCKWTSHDVVIHV